ncbi:sensor histidine kinase [Paenibacillus sp. SC116]|uniref:ATP-binding protein n=1 Tax=Paenibacillus sp. SC116 TaxID=2968986 RepID=UPI00215A1316|nr:sensor histidine kinase [Paenibacillus sp. SC116]MCR8842434.1 sensor histidine kinase [Paenibacillus sp. SC116]
MQRFHIRHLRHIRNLPVYGKIALLAFGLTSFSLLIGGIIALGIMTSMTEDELGRRLMTTARTVAEQPHIREKVQLPVKAAQDIAYETENIRMINDVSYIVVLNMDRIRYSHPITDRIGQPIAEKDAEPAFAEHSYLSKVKGEVGSALRAYVPIMNEQHHQVGVVMAGMILPSISQMIWEQRGPIAATLMLALLFGLLGAWQLSRNIKRQMYNLEPQEIARILLERTAAFQAMHEGVIAVDNKERITIFNNRAKQIFDIEGNPVGRPIRDVIPDTRLPEILTLQQPIYNRELIVRNAVIWSNRIPITVQGQTVGAIAIFQDRTELTHMAEELTGVKAFVDALRVQNHEYMNKLHTIAGLIQLEHYEQALDYLFEVSERQEELLSFVKERFLDEGIGGLLLSKISRGQEIGIHVELDKRSGLTYFPPKLDRHDFVLLLGNLIENAFDAFEASDREHKEMVISIEQDDEVLSIMVEDNANGMDDVTQQHMLEKGFSTKASEGRGIGLYLIGNIIEKGCGELVCHSSPGNGTTIIITFPMQERAS